MDITFNQAHRNLLTDPINQDVRRQFHAAVLRSGNFSAELQELSDDYNWFQTLCLAGHKQDICDTTTDNNSRYNSCYNKANISAIEKTTHATPFCVHMISQLIAKSSGEYDSSNWIILGQLYDGRYFAITAGCDYTGWD